jgi:rsbT antagonist protein RsbS
MSKILDAYTVVVGMRPAVAITMVELGLDMKGVRTSLNVDSGMGLLRNLLSNSEAETVYEDIEE